MNKDRRRVELGLEAKTKHLVLVHLQLPAAIHLYDGEFGTMVLNADGRYIGSGNYVLDGSTGNVTAITGQGSQFIFGGSGDTLTAGSGPDTFNFAANFGKNIVDGFDAHQDTIELSKAAVANVATVLADAHQVGANTVIALDAADTITLTHTLVQDLHANFILA
jgi:Ca2+-binding RTX toxin-like protein